MSLSDNFYQTAITGINDLKKTNPDIGSLLDYYGEILGLRRDTKSSFSPDLNDLDITLGRKRNSNGLPFLRVEDIKIDWNKFDALFDRVSEVSRKCAGTEEEKESWPSISGNNGKTRDALLRGILGDKDLLVQAADDTKINLDILTFLTCQALAPFLETYAEKLMENINSPSWQKGSCPVCGGQPLMGRLEKETGKRVLQCHLCSAEWEFKRLECPFCGNHDQEKQRFFFDKEDATYRMEICDSCKSYLKTVDGRKTEKDIILFVENLATIHLDLVARREGFNRDTNKLIGL